MQKLDSYPLPPGCCALCRSTATPLIDPNLNTDDLPMELAIEQSGWVYICAQCVHHMTNLLGGLDPVTAGKLTARIAHVEAEYARCRDELATAKAALRPLQAAGFLPADPEVARV